jgi:hypothetical protein
MSEVTKSAIWAFGLNVPVSLLGLWGGWGLLHNGNIILLLPFLPAIGALMLFDSTGPLPINSDALILTLSVGAQILGYFVGVLAVRRVYEKTIGEKWRHTQKKHFWE